VYKKSVIGINLSDITTSIKYETNKITIILMGNEKKSEKLVVNSKDMFECKIFCHLCENRYECFRGV